MFFYKFLSFFFFFSVVDYYNYIHTLYSNPIVCKYRMCTMFIQDFKEKTIKEIQCQFTYYSLCIYYNSVHASTDLHSLRISVDSILLYTTEGYLKAWYTCTLYQSRLRENIRTSLVSAVLSTQ